MTASTSWLRRTAAIAAAGFIGIAGPLALAGSANAASSDAAPSDVPVTDIDINDLKGGDPATIPVLSGAATHNPNSVALGNGETYGMGDSKVRSIAELSDSAALASITTHEGENRIVELADEKITVVDKGWLSGEIAVSADGAFAAWSSYDEVDDHGQPVGDTTVVGYDTGSDTVVGEQTVQDEILEPTAYWDGRTFFTPQSGEQALSWSDLDKAPQPVDGLRDITATGGGYAATTLAGSEHDTQVLDKDGHQAWTTSDYRVEAFTSDGLFAVAVDAQSDGLGATEYTILSAETGEPQAKITTELTTQVESESDGSIILDASNDGQQGLVRFFPNTDIDAELVYGAADWPNPPEDMPYLLGHR